MRIAILGWGSLIWDPKNLAIEKEANHNGWHEDGPVLPIEFARVSKDGRLTLVILSGVSDIKTMFCISKYKTIDEAELDLAIREGCARSRIGCYNKSENTFKENKGDYRSNISNWIENTDIDAVLWTNLSSNFKDKFGETFTNELAIKYLSGLDSQTKVLAEEYIRKAPQQTNTNLRKEIVSLFGWKALTSF